MTDFDPTLLRAFPIAPIAGSEGWTNAYEIGGRLDERFPGQDAEDFASAVEYNDTGPLEGRGIVDLKMIQEGENDVDAWIWHVTLDDGSTWKAEGGCDYTGWDCQSSLEWTSLPQDTTSML